MAGQLEIYDTTLRDGTQQEGISLSVDDKLVIASRLDALGIHYIEGGFAGANPKDDEFFHPGWTISVRRAGHIFGSAHVIFDIETDKGSKRVVFYLQN